MTFEVLLNTDGELILTSFESEEAFYEFEESCYAERWLFYKQIVELLEKRNELPRYGDFCGSDELVTDSLLNEAKRWQDVYRYYIDWTDEKIERFVSEQSKQNSQNFKFGKISNGDAGIHWKSVGETFNWLCHICGFETERKGGTHVIRRGCTVDHIVPQSRGGANTWNNVRPAHWECNIRKNNRL